MPQHRLKIQADQMHDPFFVRARLFVLELTAKHARRRQFRRELALDHRIAPTDEYLAK